MQVERVHLPTAFPRSETYITAPDANYSDENTRHVEYTCDRVEDNSRIIVNAESSLDCAFEGKKMAYLGYCKLQFCGPRNVKGPCIIHVRH